MTSTAPRSRGRHRTDLLSLFGGVFFLAAALWWAGAHYFDWEIDWNLPHLGWFAAGGLILLGLLGILASLRRDRTEIPVDAGPRPAPHTEAPVRPEPAIRPEPPARADPLERTDPFDRPEPVDPPTATEPPTPPQPGTGPRPGGDPAE